MMSAPEPKRVPLGKPLGWSDEDMDALATITPEDVERAKVAWRQHSPRQFRDLLDAVPDDERR